MSLETVLEYFARTLEVEGLPELKVGVLPNWMSAPGKGGYPYFAIDVDRTAYTYADLYATEITRRETFCPMALAIDLSCVEQGETLISQRNKLVNSIKQVILTNSRNRLYAQDGPTGARIEISEIQFLSVPEETIAAAILTVKISQYND